MNLDVPLIVLVDDVHENVRILHHCLKVDGYTFAVAKNAEELFCILEIRPVTLILLDVMLPDMDGFSVAVRLRDMERFAEIPIIFISARIEQGDRNRGFMSGAVDYITKPFDCTEVRERVRTHVRLRRALQEQQRLNAELQAAFDRIRTLEGIIPICSKCKKVRDDDGYWTQVEQYISKHTNAMFTHGLCPHCAGELFPTDVIHGKVL